MSTKYVKNKDLMVEVKLYLKTCKYDENGKYIMGSGVCSNTLGEMILLIANGMSNKGNFRGYTYKEDMVGDGVITVLKYLKNFNPEKSNNPFAYISQIVYNSFVAHITKQKKHSMIKQELFDNSDSINDYNELQAINYKDLKVE